MIFQKIGGKVSIVSRYYGETGTKMKTLERKRTTDHEPLAQCPDCSGNGICTIGQYNDGEFREGFCQTCEGRGAIPLQQYLLDIREEEEVGA